MDSLSINFNGSTATAGVKQVGSISTAQKNGQGNGYNRLKGLQYASGLQNSSTDELLAEADGLLTSFALQTDPGCVMVRQYLMAWGWSFNRSPAMKETADNLNGCTYQPACATSCDISARQAYVQQHQATPSYTIREKTAATAVNGMRKPFKCPLCPFSASQRRGVIAHLLRIHEVNGTASS